MNRSIICFVAAISVSAFAQNLVINGNFDNRYTGWNRPWSGNCDIGDHTADYGENPAVNQDAGVWWTDNYFYQDITISADEYTVSVDMINASNHPLTGGRQAVLIAQVGDAPGDNRWEQEIMIGSGASINTWVRGSTVIDNTTAGASNVRLILLLRGSGTGNAYFDNISMTGQPLPTINDPDFNDDTKVDLLDLAALASVWNQTSSIYNLSGRELIDLEDLQVFAGAWLTTISPYPGYELVWSDEFNSPVINSQNWTHQIGTDGDGWGNWEWQYYTARSQNSRIENGKLLIEAKKENYGGMSYTSARLTTQNKYSFKYGRVEARIKLPPGGHGIWPAFWMLGNNYPSVGWPTCGEQDIIEIQSDPTEAQGTIHYAYPNGDHASLGGTDRSAGNLSNDYHLYAIEWDATGIRWYRDDYNYYSVSSWSSNAGPFPAPFNQPFFIILNFAVGAYWFDKDITNAAVSFPQQMLVDYVRVYQKTP